jgi:hypothetical protein
MIDVTEEINAIRRTVGTRTLEAGEARVITVSRSYATTLDDLWDACTNAERIPRWFLPVSGDLRALPVRGQRRRHDRALRPAAQHRGDVGVRRRRELGAAAPGARERGPHAPGA